MHPSASTAVTGSIPLTGPSTAPLARSASIPLDRDDASLVALVEAVRLGPGIAPLVAGLFLLAWHQDATRRSGVDLPSSSSNVERVADQSDS